MTESSWNKMINERDAEGNLTPLALALDALQDHGCDCGTDEPGTCLACRCEAALRAQWEEIDSLVDMLEEVAVQACHAMVFGPDLDSCAIGIYAYALRELAERGRVRIITDVGRRVIARRVEDES